MPLVLHSETLSPASEEELQDRLKAKLEESYKIRVHDIHQSIRLATSVLDTATLHHLADLIAKAQNLLGLFLMIVGDYEQSRYYSYEALKTFEEQENLKGIADARYNLASTYYKTDDFHSGLQEFLGCLLLYRTLKDHHNEARVLKSLGTIYEYFGDTDKAVESYEKSIEAARIANDPGTESNAYNPLSGIYLKQGEFEKAMEIAERSIRIKKATHDERGLAFSLYGRGKVYFRQHRFDLAEADFRKSLSIQRQMCDHLGEGMVLNKLGLIYMKRQDFELSRNTLMGALAIGEHFNIRLIRYKAYFNLYELYKQQKQFEQASFYLEKYIHYKEATLNAHTLKVIKSYESINALEALERESKAQRDKFEIVQRKNAELDSFFYRVSHDLKGPIASLIGLHNLIKYENFDPGASQYFDMYHSQVMRINTIVMDLIELTRMDNIMEKKVKINFDKIIQDCIQSFAYHENFKKISFISDIDPELNFYSQWIILNTILQNLIENSIKYSRPEAEAFIKISIHSAESKIKITVEDNGQGIPEVFQEHIFEMFYRANEKSEGSGLGLYILKRAVERLQGEIHLLSHEGIGTTFTVCLPR